MSDTLNVVRYGWEQLEQEEKPTSGTVAAGHLVENSGGALQPHSTDGGAVDQVLFAKDMRGRGYEFGDEYPDGEFITYVIANSGVGLRAMLADGESVDGDAETRLVSAGDGTLRAYDGGGGDTAEDVVAVAKETYDNSAGGSPAPIDIEVTR